MSKVIDSHVHLGIRPDTILTAEMLLERMDQTGQDMAVVFPMVVNLEVKGPFCNAFSGNDYMAAAQEAYPNRIIGLGAIQPWFQNIRVMNNELWQDIKKKKSYNFLQQKVGLIPDDWWKKDPTLDEIERAILDLKLWGLKLHPLQQGFLINNMAVVAPIFERMVSCSRKVGRRLLVLVHCMADTVFAVPEQIADLAEQYPDLMFIIAHMGGIWTAQSGIRVTKEYENILLDFTWVSNEKNMKEAIRILGAKKIICGTDFPFGSFELKMFMMERMFPDPEERGLVLGGNIQRVLGIK